MLRRKKNGASKQGGFILTLELIVTATCMMCVLVISWGALGSKLVSEVGDIGTAVGSLNQGYTMTGMAVGHPNDPNHPTDIATWGGSSFGDGPDFCDTAACDAGVRLCIAPAHPVDHATCVTP